MDSEIVFTRTRQFDAVYGEIILNRPEKGNALTMPMLERLSTVVSEIEADRDLRAIVIRGRGRFFCTGGDIAAWSALSPNDMGRHWILYGINVLERLAALPQPVIAVVSGHALGGGPELALAADLRIAVQSAKFGAPEVTLGMISGWMGIRRLAENIGVARARHLTLLGAPISAAQALDWGLITALAEDAGSLEEQLNGWLERLCANAPGAIALTKGILAGMHADLREHHASAAAQAISTEDCAEGVRAFREKRKPVFRNR
ncbi:MAG: enoyl-CoA hydratase/isomerase family protein [Acidobacteriaceae bacterium]|nr:enoyl-CoA hydratase/isomerase family protein [Acidobacteriaceae bacterium]